MSCTTSIAEPGSRRVGINLEVPEKENHEAQKAVPDPERGTSPDFPWLGIANTLYQPTETNLESITESGNYVVNVVQSGNRSAILNSATSSIYLETVLQDLPEVPLEHDNLTQDNHEGRTAVLQRSTSPWSRIDNTLYQRTETDFSVERTTQQGSYAADTTQCENRLVGMNNATSPDYLDIVLPDLPEISMDDDALLQDNYEFQNSVPERSTSETALWFVADNMLHQLMEPDFFPYQFHSPASPPSVSHPNALAMQSDDRPISQKTRSPPNALLSDMGHHSPAPTASRMSQDGTGPSSESRHELRSKQKALVRKLVDYAITASDVPPDARRRHWQSVSIEVCTVFELVQPNDSEDCILVQMVHLYQQNLLPLWPMICELEDATSLHPVLFMVAVSVGAMYLDKNASVFGTLMHKSLCLALITSFIEKEITESDTIWLAQARNTIQVVALYFGQGLELTYAQHLGAVLVTQSRRMNLFTRAGLEDYPAGSTPAEQVAAWIRAETRRRVAFGIYRADVFLSLLLNCPPIISANELQISLPYPDSLWMSIGKLSPEELLAALERERMKRNDNLFCDLIRIMLDRDEVLLNMETRDYELLLFGLQEQVWKFSHDPDMFQRLIGHPWQEEGSSESLDVDVNLIFNSSALHARDHLETNKREMKDLVLERRRLSKALEKWSQSFNANRFRLGFNKDRGSILSSLLLFHIYHLQLNASLDALHHIADRLCNQRPIDHKRLQTAICWANSAQSKTAAQHASKIWSLLDNEARMNPMKKARYTMLSFMGLYHASVVLWTCFGVRRAGEHPSFASRNDGIDGGQHSRSYDVLMNIVFLYQRMKCMSWDAFAESVRRLSCCEFPRDQS